MCIRDRHPIGSDFRQEVWALLLQIPYGQTTTYGALAARLAAKHGTARLSAQAVGGAEMCIRDRGYPLISTKTAPMTTIPMQNALPYPGCSGKQGNRLNVRFFSCTV